MIQVENLSKYFGPIMAIDRISFSVGQGEIVGFLGLNGAGKSTTMRVVVGLDAPDAGTATIGGRPCARPVRSPHRPGRP